LQKNGLDVLEVRLFGGGVGLGSWGGGGSWVVGEGREEIDDCTGEPVSLVGRVGTAPVVLNGEREGRPEVKGVSDGLLEVGLSDGWKEVSQRSNCRKMLT
jgi:hypothetical protein